MMGTCNDCGSSCVSACTGSSFASEHINVKSLLASVYDIQVNSDPVVESPVSESATHNEECGCGFNCYSVCGESCVSSAASGSAEVLENESKDSSARVIITTTSRVGMTSIKSSNLINKKI